MSGHAQDALGVKCNVDDCGNRVVGLDDGWEHSRGVVCQDCIDYHDRHGHWPDEGADICIECRVDEGMVKHKCDESAADAILVEPGSQCDYCGFEAAMTDGGVVDRTVEQLGDVPVCTGCGFMSHVEMHGGICAECWMRANRRAGGGTLKIQAGSVYHDSVGCEGVQEADQWRYVTDEDVVYATTGDSDMHRCEQCSLIKTAP